MDDILTVPFYIHTNSNQKHGKICENFRFLSRSRNETQPAAALSDGDKGMEYINLKVSMFLIGISVIRKIACT